MFVQSNQKGTVLSAVNTMRLHFLKVFQLMSANSCNSTKEQVMNGVICFCCACVVMWYCFATTDKAEDRENLETAMTDLLDEVQGAVGTGDIFAVPENQIAKAQGKEYTSNVSMGRESQDMNEHMHDYSYVLLIATINKNLTQCSFLIHSLVP